MATDQFNLVGQVLASLYFIREVVGEDAAGVLYKATCQNSDRLLAVKCLKIPHGEERPFFLSRFRDEERSLSKINQSLIGLRVINHGITNLDGLELPFVVMDWLDGQYLDTPQRRTLPPPATFSTKSRGISTTDRMGKSNWQLKPALAFAASRAATVKHAAFSIARF